MFSGMVGVTLFGIFLTPIFFWIVDGFQKGNKSHGIWGPTWRFLKREILSFRFIRQPGSWLMRKISAGWKKLAQIRISSKDKPPNTATPTGT